MTSPLPHSTYLKSPRWLDRHPHWLQQAHHHCMAFPWVAVGKTKQKYHRYHVHHLHYRQGYQGTEILGRDVVVLCPAAHWFIHRVLGGASRVRDQKSPYPNAAQRIAHAWCCCPTIGKLLILLALCHRIATL